MRTMQDGIAFCYIIVTRVNSQSKCNSGVAGGVYRLIVATRYDRVFLSAWSDYPISKHELERTTSPSARHIVAHRGIIHFSH